MDLALRLVDLAAMHPLLLWDTIITATAAILEGQGHAPWTLPLVVQDIPGFGSGELRFVIDPVGIGTDRIARVRRTYEPSRLVELAAIAVASAGLHYAGRHEIRDVAARGSAADYLIDEGHYHLEVAGRSRRTDLETAWQQKWQRLGDRATTGVFVCVVEFESPAGRLAFRAEGE